MCLQACVFIAFFLPDQPPALFLKGFRGNATFIFSRKPRGSSSVRQGTRAAPRPPAAPCSVGRQIGAYGTTGQKYLRTLATWPVTAGVEGNQGRLFSRVDSCLGRVLTAGMTRCLLQPRKQLKAILRPVEVAGLPPPGPHGQAG